MKYKFKSLILSFAVMIGLIGSQKAFAGIGAGLNVGLDVAPIIGTGLDVFYDLGRVISGRHYSKGSGDFKDLLDLASVDGISIEKLDAEATMTSIDARLFLLFGMNVFAGIGERKIDIDYGLRDSTFGLDVNGTIATKSTIAKAGFGTMFRLGVVYIGLDLAAVHTATSGSSSATISTPILMLLLIFQTSIRIY